MPQNFNPIPDTRKFHMPTIATLDLRSAVLGFFASGKARLNSAMTKCLMSLSLVFLLAACGGSDDADRTYVGQVAGTDAYIGIVENGDQMLAYVCDGNGISRWFKGGYSQALASTLTSGGQTLVVQSTPLGLQGTVDVDGVPKTFTARQVPQGSEAGLYRVDVPIDDQAIVGGWVVLEDQTRRGLVSLGGTTLSTSSLSFSSGTVQVTSPTLTSFVSVKPATAITTSCSYSGTVTNAAGSRLAGVRVRVFDTSAVPERLVGETTTDATGGYRLSVNQPSPSPTKTYRAVVINSAGQVVAQGSATASCGATIHLVVR
jgi:hypothetical protein